MAARSSLPHVAAQHAARVICARAALGSARPASSAAAVATMVRTLGYVQIDSIAAVERAHDTILRTRLKRYSPDHLRRAAEVDRTIFEHWTHDAAFVPAAWIPFWHVRFRRDAKRLLSNAWWQGRAGKGGPRLMRDILEHVRTQGPTRARDLNARAGRAPGGQGGWWEWSPHKAALEALWRSGRLAVARRDGFQKAYDLFHRVHPEVRETPATAAEHRQWACSHALERLGIATAREIARFFGDLDAADVERWARTPKGRALAVPVLRECADGGAPQRAFATPDALEPPAGSPSGVRLLSPFDPVVRDRARLERLWGFSYRFEAFVPGAKRVDGYYTLPVLDGHEFIGRCALRADRERGTMALERWRAHGTERPLPPRVREAIHAYAAELHLRWTGRGSG